MFPRASGMATVKDNTQDLALRVRRCHGLPPLHALTFTMGNYSRLGRTEQTALAAADKGKDFAYVSMPGELVQQLVKVCGVWLEGQAGELPGLVRLLGGDMINERCAPFSGEGPKSK